MIRLAVTACTLVGAVAAATVRASTLAPIFRGPFGPGASAVWLLEPRSPPTSVVVFLHGWKVAPPSTSYQWVGQFRPWLDHLVAGGSAVLFPAYQTGGDVEGPARVTSLRRGLEEGFRRLPHLGLSVVVVGYSYGASLAFYSAANARNWDLPAPTAVDAVFPAGLIAGAELPELAAQVQVLIEVGDEDTVAGRAGADAFWSWLSGRHGAPQRLVVVRSSSGFTAAHAAPKLSTPPARSAFWRPLDRLIARARGDARESQSIIG
jgi:acetyl esterase/lipase